MVIRYRIKPLLVVLLWWVAARVYAGELVMALVDGHTPPVTRLSRTE